MVDLARICLSIISWVSACFCVLALIWCSSSRVSTFFLSCVQVSIVSLQLVATLLKKNDPHVIANLLLCQLVGQRYLVRKDGETTATQSPRQQPVANGVESPSPRREADSTERTDGVVSSQMTNDTSSPVATDRASESSMGRSAPRDEEGAVSSGGPSSPKVEDMSTALSLLNSSFVNSLTEPEAVTEMYTELQRTESVVTWSVTIAIVGLYSCLFLVAKNDTLDFVWKLKNNSSLDIRTRKYSHIAVRRVEVRIWRSINRTTMLPVVNEKSQLLEI